MLESEVFDGNGVVAAGQCEAVTGRLVLVWRSEVSGVPICVQSVASFLPEPQDHFLMWLPAAYLYSSLLA